MATSKIILANGEFPRKGGEARRLLETADIIVACDGAADALRRRLRRTADFVVGDFDSMGVRTIAGAELVHIPDQSTNDLTKAIDFCRGRGWRNLVIVGATGRREDHTLGNVFRAMEAGVPIITDEGRFLPLVRGSGRWGLRLKVRRGQAISVFATDPGTRMVSKGLEWPLDGVEFKNLYCATLNRAASTRIEISSTRPAFVFLSN